MIILCNIVLIISVFILGVIWGFVMGLMYSKDKEVKSNDTRTELEI